MSEIALRSGTEATVFERCEFTKTGLVIGRNVTFDEWLQIGDYLKLIESGSRWWIGDWLNAGEQRYGDMYVQAQDETDYENGTLRNAKWVASKYELSCRHDNLSFEHHYEALHAPDPPAALQWAIDNGTKTADGKWRPASKAALRQHVRALKIAQIGADYEAKTPSGKYHVIVLDPPWRYDGGELAHDSEGFRGVVDYPTMSLEEIAGIELPTADDCVLWFWTTHRFMRHALDMLEAWGFEEKAVLTWVKDRMGIGRWLRSKSEFCVMAVKGSPPVNLTNQTTVLEAPLREHSRKPDEFYAMVDALCVGRKLDYFSRQKREGWDQYGNDADRF